MWHISGRLVVGIFGFHVMQTTQSERDAALTEEEEEENQENKEVEEEEEEENEEESSSAALKQAATITPQILDESAVPHLHHQSQSMFPSPFALPFWPPHCPPPLS